MQILENTQLTEHRCKHLIPACELSHTNSDCHHTCERICWTEFCSERRLVERKRICLDSYVVSQFDHKSTDCNPFHFKTHLTDYIPIVSKTDLLTFIGQCIKNQMQRLLSFLTVLLCGKNILHAQMLALRNDALLDAAMIPNVSVEIVTTSQTSISITTLGSYRIWGKKGKTIGVLPEFRWWFTGTPLSRFYLGAGVAGGHYDLQLHNQFYKGRFY